ncbi:MAG: hypothetical protein KJ645_06025 [Planctomycetes bacterium]|nr:hypothetical protein [Planctomycetota bacterium]
MSRRFQKLLLWGVLCLGALVLMKWQILAGYGVITSSMEPTLLGDPETGDRVAVFKLGYRWSKPDRHDLAVFFKEGERKDRPGLFERSGGKVYVKRLAAKPGDTLLIQDGDLYLGADEQRIDCKPLSLIRSILIPCYRARFDEAFFDEWTPYTSTPGQPFTLMEDGLQCDTLSQGDPSEAELVFSPSSGAIRDGYLLDDDRSVEGQHPVNDVALKLDFELTRGLEEGQVFGELNEGSDLFRFSLRSAGAGGGGEVSHYTGQLLVHRMALAVDRFEGLEEGRAYSLLFMNIDNQVFLLLDDRLLAEFAYEKNTYLHNNAPNNLPLFGVKGACVNFTGIEVDRDLYYTADRGTFAVKTPYTVPEGYYFFLGDYSAQSEDSRSFGPIPEGDLVGQPFLIYAPWDRIRFL